MRKRFGLTVAAASIAILLLGASSASAATEFGDNCMGNDAEDDVTLFEISAPGNPLPTAAPSAGVITKWKSNLTPIPASLPQTLKILRPDEIAKTVQIVAEATQNVGGGLNAFDARIPVQTGDRLGLFGPGPLGTLFCDVTSPPGVLGAFNGGGALGATNPFVEVPAEERVPVAAILEPDADADGFGDETQDKCPQSAATQLDCPVVVLDSFAMPKKGKAVVLVATSTSTKVTVSGTVRLPKRPKGARKSAQAKLRKVTKTVTAGKLTRFTLNFPASLKKALAELPRRKSLTLNLQATATSLAGRVSKDRAKLKLKG